ncbi:hypothetical protein B0H16DRAFT_823578 [Mycena metata]|uniref:Uncharacterized protein n=1 Tax=Mycena metata TaxID=1033252 RepID=A0AAD7N9N5_9AGAR|nr:hypothetical protein B0H16DRAFT_823578 [Mycena metata]
MGQQRRREGWRKSRDHVRAASRSLFDAWICVMRDGARFPDGDVESNCARRWMRGYPAVNGAAPPHSYGLQRISADGSVSVSSASCWTWGLRTRADTVPIFFLLRFLSFSALSPRRPICGRMGGSSFLSPGVLRALEVGNGFVSGIRYGYEERIMHAHLPSYSSDGCGRRVSPTSIGCDRGWEGVLDTFSLFSLLDPAAFFLFWACSLQSTAAEHLLFCVRVLVAG